MSERPSRHQRRPSQSFPISLDDLSDISLAANPPSSVPTQPPRHQIPPPSPAAPPANNVSQDPKGTASSN
ncbi:hypothetical protein CARUB_v10002393mg [Capsella rubella]|uniref:Uncharacterized protein n=1 Tax=Capsella rubella TaxID=81985 RepID=R0HA86_9BRAS|nr:uncharacterized protein LOC17883755 [Capsella rubella]EOA21910.1 hypothetical protein CARUB_v10002393mg [Capsella rubella]